MAGNGRFSGKCEAAAAALAAGRSVTAAACAAGIGERTLYRWKADPAFTARVREIQAELLRRAVGRLSDAMPRAAVTLRRLLGSADAKVRLAAAARLLDAGLKVRDRLELEERVAALERVGVEAALAGEQETAW